MSQIQKVFKQGDDYILAQTVDGTSYTFSKVDQFYFQSQVNRGNYIDIEASQYIEFFRGCYDHAAFEARAYAIGKENFSNIGKVDDSKSSLTYTMENDILTVSLKMQTEVQNNSYATIEQKFVIMQKHRIVVLIGKKKKLKLNGKIKTVHRLPEKSPSHQQCMNSRWLPW